MHPQLVVPIVSSGAAEQLAARATLRIVGAAKFPAIETVRMRHARYQMLQYLSVDTPEYRIFAMPTLRLLKPRSDSSGVLDEVRSSQVEPPGT